MNFLGFLVPGLREFRVPFSVGAIWIAATVILAIPYATILEREYRAGFELATSLPNYLQAGTLLFATYLFGVAADRATRGAFSALERVVQGRSDSKFAHVIYGKILPTGLIYSAYVRIWSSPESRATEEDVLDYAQIKSRSLPPGTTPLSRALIPEIFIQQDFGSGANHYALLVQNPALHAINDRIRNEAQFREALCFPLLLLGLASVWTWALWGLPMLAACLALVVGLIRDASRKNVDAERVLRFAVTQGLLQLPTLSSMSSYLEEGPHNYSEARILEWCVREHRFRRQILLDPNFQFQNDRERRRVTNRIRRQYAREASKRDLQNPLSSEDLYEIALSCITSTPH